MGAFLVMKWQFSVESVKMDFLFRDPSQRDNSRSHAFHNGRGMWGEPQGSVEVAVGHVHQDRLRHIVEVMAKGDDVSANPVG
jgi:hypothetical protein